MNRLFLLPILMVMSSVCWADSRSENEPYVPSNTENPPAVAPAQPKANKSVIPNLKGDDLKAYSKGRGRLCGLAENRGERAAEIVAATG